VESREQALEVAEQVAAAGAGFLRGGAFKPRTSPYAFAGHGEAALGWLKEAAERFGLGVVTEAVTEADVKVVAERADVLQVGSRSMHSPGLLRAAGRAGRPVLLKRGMSATVEEWLLAAERLLLEGAPGVILCERGVRSFDPTTRNVLDLGAVALLAGVRGLPVIVDPSHAAGRRDLVLPLARAALAAGAAGVLVEVHPRPGEAASDGPQAVRPEELFGLLADVTVPNVEDGTNDTGAIEFGREPAAGAGRQ
jgi:3-deoxy-7-phosphoheptulonate synthase